MPSDHSTRVKSHVKQLILRERIYDPAHCVLVGPHYLLLTLPRASYIVSPMTLTAPNFPSKSKAGYVYPRDAKLMSTAWATAWRLLHECSKPVGARALAGMVAAINGNVSESSVKNLLRDAATEGILVSIKGDGHMAQPFYALPGVATADDTADTLRIPASYRPFRELLKANGPMTKTALRNALVDAELLTESRFRFAFSKIITTEYVNGVGGKWEWVGA